VNLLLAGEFGDGEEAEWLQALRAALPGHTVRSAQDASGSSPGIDRNSVAAAIVANPPAGSLSGLPGLRLIQSLWAGVDRLLADPTLPAGVPIARMVDPAMTAAMAESALWATLSLHRGFFSYAQQQRVGLWRRQPQQRADEVPVLVLGHGQMGRAVAQRLAQQGYPVTAWRRGTTALDRADADASTGAGVRLAVGPAALAQALSGARIVINLLPLTPDTRGLIDARLLGALPHGAGLVNLARGAHVVDADLLEALDSGQIGQAVLDVFHAEPLPPAHPFWQHARVTVLPHAAAATDARSAAAVVARNIEALAAGLPLADLVARSTGY